VQCPDASLGRWKESSLAFKNFRLFAQAIDETRVVFWRPTSLGQDPAGTI